MEASSEGAARCLRDTNCGRAGFHRQRGLRESKKRTVRWVAFLIVLAAFFQAKEVSSDKYVDCHEHSAHGQKDAKQIVSPFFENGGSGASRITIHDKTNNII